jgi:hypothetical protein
MIAHARRSPANQSTECTAVLSCQVCRAESSLQGEKLFSCLPHVTPTNLVSLITINHPWRYIYYVAIALIGTTLLLAFFTFPETVYIRPIDIDTDNEPTVDCKRDEAKVQLNESPSSSIPPKKTYLQQLKIFSGTYTEETFWRLFARPFALILLPPVLWCSLVQSVTIGFIVAVTSNVASAYQQAYGMKPYQTGLCFIAAIIGALVGIFCGGYLGDRTADYFTKRNSGIREPEMRLPAMMFSLISTPLSLILYGVGIQNQLHWMCPTVGLALLNFSIVQGTNVALVYTIDAYRPIAGEVTLTTMAFKCKISPSILVIPRSNVTNSCLRIPSLLLYEPMD